MDFEYDDDLHRELSEEDKLFGKTLLDKLQEYYTVVMVPRAAFRVHNNGELASDEDDYVNWNYNTKAVNGYKLPSVGNTIDFIVAELVADIGKSKLLYVLSYGFNMVTIKENNIETKYPTIRLSI
jgi:hypothetical protein